MDEVSNSDDDNNNNDNAYGTAGTIKGFGPVSGALTWDMGRRVGRTLFTMQRRGTLASPGWTGSEITKLMCTRLHEACTQTGLTTQVRTIRNELRHRCSLTVRRMEPVAREAILPAVGTATMLTQLGSGLHGGACDVAQLMLRARIRRAKRAKWHLAAIFVDVSSVYATVNRAFALKGCSKSCDLWSERLAKTGRTVPEIDQVIAHAFAPDE